MEIDIKSLPDDKQRIVLLLSSKNKALSSKNKILSSQNKTLSSKNETLSSKNETLSSKNKKLSIENGSLQSQVLELEEQLRLLKAKHYGISSEKIKEHIDNLEHSIEEIEVGLGINIEKLAEERHPEKKKAKRKKLPESLPREEIIVEAPKKCTECGSEALRKIGEDISEVLEYIPASFKVLRYIRPHVQNVKQ